MPQFEDLRQAAFQSQKEANSYQAKQGVGRKSDSSKFPEARAAIWSSLF